MKSLYLCKGCSRQGWKGPPIDHHVHLLKPWGAWAAIKWGMMKIIRLKWFGGDITQTVSKAINSRVHQPPQTFNFILFLTLTSWGLFSPIVIGSVEGSWDYPRNFMMAYEASKLRCAWFQSWPSCRYQSIQSEQYSGTCALIQWAPWISGRLSTSKLWVESFTPSRYEVNALNFEFLRRKGSRGRLVTPLTIHFALLGGSLYVIFHFIDDITSRQTAPDWRLNRKKWETSREQMCGNKTSWYLCFQISYVVVCMCHISKIRGHHFPLWHDLVHGRRLFHEFIPQAGDHPWIHSHNKSCIFSYIFWPSDFGCRGNYQELSDLEMRYPPGL